MQQNNKMSHGRKVATAAPEQSNTPGAHTSSTAPTRYVKQWARADIAKLFVLTFSLSRNLAKTVIFSTAANLSRQSSSVIAFSTSSQSFSAPNGRQMLCKRTCTHRFDNSECSACSRPHKLKRNSLPKSTNYNFKLLK